MKPPTYVDLVDFNVDTMDIGVDVFFDEGQALVYGTWNKHEQCWTLWVRTCSRGLNELKVLESLSTVQDNALKPPHLSTKRLTEELLVPSQARRVIAAMVAKELDDVP